MLNTILRQPVSDKAREERRRNLLLKIIIEHAPQRHSSEVAWSVWGCIVQSFSIPREALQPLVKMEDSICALVALHARSLKLAESPAELDSLAAALTSDELYDSRWMLAYEAAVRNWLPSPSGTDFVGGDVNFSKLKASGVNFYNVSKTALPPLPPTKAKTAPPEGYDLLDDSGDDGEPEEYEGEGYY